MLTVPVLGSISPILMVRGFIRSAREVTNVCSVSSMLMRSSTTTTVVVTSRDDADVLFVAMVVPLRNPCSASFVHSIGVIILTTTKHATREWISDIIIVLMECRKECISMVGCFFMIPRLHFSSFR